MYLIQFILLFFSFIFIIILIKFLFFSVYLFILVFICLIYGLFIIFIIYYFKFDLFKSFFLINGKVCKSISSTGRKSGLLFNCSYILNKSNHNRHLSYINFRYKKNVNRSNFFWVYYEEGFKGIDVRDLYTNSKNPSDVSVSYLKLLLWQLNLTYNVTGRYFYLDIIDLNKDSYLFYTLNNNPNCIRAYKVIKANYRFFLNVLGSGTGRLDLDCSLISFNNIKNRKNVNFFSHIEIPTKNILIKSDLENTLSYCISKDILRSYYENFYKVEYHS